MSEQLTLTIEAKVLGQRKPIVASWSVMVPPAPATTEGDHQMTLRALLTAVVTDEVAAFHERQQERRLARVLTGAEIGRGATLGKIDPGGGEPQAVRLEDAIAAALQAFADRLYVVLLDGAPVEALDTELALREGSRLTFVRLVALVGG